MLCVHHTKKRKMFPVFRAQENFRTDQRLEHNAMKKVGSALIGGGSLSAASFNENEGWLLIKKRSSKTFRTNAWKKRYVKIDEEQNCVLLYNFPNDVGVLSPKYSFPLTMVGENEGIVCKVFVDGKSKKHCFTLQNSLDPSKKITAAAYSEEEVGQWVDAIELLLSDKRSNGNSGKFRRSRPGGQREEAREKTATHPVVWQDVAVEEDDPFLDKFLGSEKNMLSDPETDLSNPGADSVCSLDPLGLLGNEGSQEVKVRRELMKKMFYAKPFDPKTYLETFYRNATRKDLVSALRRMKDNQVNIDQSVANIVNENFVSVVSVNELGDEICSERLFEMPAAKKKLRAYERENSTLVGELNQFAEEMTGLNELTAALKKITS